MVWTLLSSNHMIGRSIVWANVPPKCWNSPYKETETTFHLLPQIRPDFKGWRQREGGGFSWVELKVASVTRWLRNFSILGHLQQYKICPKSIVCRIRSKFWKNHKNCNRLWKYWKTEIKFRQIWSHSTWEGKVILLLFA